MNRRLTSVDTVFKLERKEIIEIIVLIVAMGFLINILAQVVWENFLKGFAFWSVIGLVILSVLLLLITYFTLFIAKKHEICSIIEFYLVRRLENEIPEESIIPGYTGHLYAQCALRVLASKSPDFSRKVTERWDCLVDPICLDLMEYILIKWLGEKYHDGWLVRKLLTIEKYNALQILNKKATLISHSDIKNQLSGNIFLPLLDKHYAMKLPPSTKMFRNIAKIQWMNPCRELEFKNLYCTLTITFQNTWQLNRLYEKLSFFVEPQKGEYQTHYYQIQIRTKFNRWLASILPRADQYYIWATNLAMEMKKEFDLEQYLSGVYCG